MVSLFTRLAGRRSRSATLIATSALAVISAVAGAPARAQNLDVPCTDGVFYGDVAGYYQDILAEHAANPSGSLFSTLSLEKQNMVTECAGRADGPDSERYALREVATDGQGNIIGRVYDYLDPVRSPVCPGSAARAQLPPGAVLLRGAGVVGLLHRQRVRRRCLRRERGMAGDRLAEQGLHSEFASPTRA